MAPLSLVPVPSSSRQFTLIGIVLEKATVRRIGILTVFVCLLCAPHAQAQFYPSKPSQLIVSFAAGSAPDILARGLADGLSADLGQPILVVNREGASGTIAFAAVASASPDGYTLAFGPSGSITIQPHLKSKLPYQFDSFQPICQVFEDRFVIVVGPNSPITDFNDLVSRARAKPKSLTYGSPGLGTVPSLMVEGLARTAGFVVIHAPYRNTGQELQDVLSGTLDFAVVTGASVRGLNIRVLASLNAVRNAQFPDAPPVSELGYPASKPGFGGLYAPRGIPSEVSDRLGQACTKAFSAPAFQQAAINAASPATFLTSTDFAKRLAEDSREKGDLIKALGITIE
jgi:tripartite-type tricarboxylate transporter receptor subunit TctC